MQWSDGDDDLARSESSILRGDSEHLVIVRDKNGIRVFGDDISWVCTDVADKMTIEISRSSGKYFIRTSA